MRNLVQHNIVNEPWIVGEILCSLYSVRYFWLMIAALILPVRFPKALLQLLEVALIAGIKWVVAGIPQHGYIVILKGGNCHVE